MLFMLHWATLLSTIISPVPMGLPNIDESDDQIRGPIC
jgi:hypothetical protein